MTDNQHIEKACEDEAFQAALQRYAHANGSSMAIMHAAALALATPSIHGAVAAIKELAAEAYAKEFPLSGGDVANCLAEAGLLTREEFIGLVEKHDPSAAIALRSPRLVKSDGGTDARIPF